MEAYQNVQFASDEPMIRSVQASFRDASDCSHHLSEKNFENNWLLQERKRRTVEGRSREKCDVVPPLQLLQKEGKDCCKQE